MACCVKFCYKTGKTANKFSLLNVTLNDDALTRSTAFEWYKRLKSGGETWKGRLIFDCRYMSLMKKE
jgi:hypothetical protein